MAQGLPEGAVLINDQEETEGGLPEGAVLLTPAMPREDTPEEIADEKGFFESFSDWFTGADRMTPQQEGTPTIIEGGFLHGEDPAKVALIANMALLTNDQNELANIIQKNFPDVRIQYNKDKQGEIYPILVNPNNGQTAIIDRPGMDALDLSQFAGQAALFSLGPKGGALKQLALEGAKEGFIQTSQAATGGDFDSGDVITAAALGGTLEKVGDAAGFAYRAAKGQAADSVKGVLAASKEFNVPVMTSDIYNPTNWFERGAQIASEWLPVVGTGGLRHAQQEARERATNDFISMYRGGTYEEVVQEIASKSSQMKKSAGDVYNKVNPYLDQISQDGGIPLNNGQKELDKLMDYILTPGREVEDNVFNLADDLDAAFRGKDQSFQIVKDNIGAWHSRMDSLDPATRVNDSKVKSMFQGVLRGLRKDRDEFAKNNLSDIEYDSLKQVDALWGEAINDMGTTKLKSILNKGEATPEVVRQMMFSRNKSDIDRLYKSLTPKGRSSAQAAFITQIADDLSNQRGGLTASSFQGKMNRYSDGIDALFKGKDKDAVEGFMNLMETTSRAQEVAKGSGSETFERLGGLGAMGAGIGAVSSGSVPMGAFAAYASLGGVARLFESPKVRNILIKAKTMKPGSDAIQQLGTDFNRALLASLQANPLKGTTEFERELSEMMSPSQKEPVLNKEGDL